MKANRITKQNGKIETTQVDVPEPVYSVRIKPEIYEPLAVQAAQEHRSVTAHVNYVLEQHLANRIK